MKPSSGRRSLIVAVCLLGVPRIAIPGGGGGPGPAGADPVGGGSTGCASGQRVGAPAAHSTGECAKCDPPTTPDDPGTPITPASTPPTSPEDANATKKRRGRHEITGETYQMMAAVIGTPDGTLAPESGAFQMSCELVISDPNPPT